MPLLKSNTIFSAAVVAAGLALSGPASTAPSVNTGVIHDAGRAVEPQLVHMGRPGYHCHPTKYRTIVGRRGHVRRIIVTPGQCHAGWRGRPRYYGGHRY